MIIAGGVNIYPAEIEGEILAHPQVGDVAVFGIPDDDMGEQIKAVVEPAPGVDGRRRAPRVDHEPRRGPAGQVQVAADHRLRRRAPREPTGKLLKRQLRDPYWEGRDRASLSSSRSAHSQVVAEEVGGGLELLAHPGEVADAVAPATRHENHTWPSTLAMAASSSGSVPRGRPGAARAASRRWWRPTRRRPRGRRR